MLKILTLIGILAWPLGSANAQENLSVEEFERLSTGKTMQFSRLGRPYGAEQFYPNRRVAWAFEGQSCSLGQWYEGEVGTICFQYETMEGEQCWVFSKDVSGTVFARHVAQLDAPPLKVDSIKKTPIDCPLLDAGS